MGFPPVYIDLIAASLHGFEIPLSSLTPVNMSTKRFNILSPPFFNYSAFYPMSNLLAFGLILYFIRFTVYLGTHLVRYWRKVDDYWCLPRFWEKHTFKQNTEEIVSFLHVKFKGKRCFFSKLRRKFSWIKYKPLSKCLSD